MSFTGGKKAEVHEIKRRKIARKRNAVPRWQTAARFLMNSGGVPKLQLKPNHHHAKILAKAKNIEMKTSKKELER